MAFFKIYFNRFSLMSLLVFQAHGPYGVWHLFIQSTCLNPLCQAYSKWINIRKLLFCTLELWTHWVFPLSGEDPLIDDQNDHDINSVAGVLKLYFRGLENPLFPKERFLDFISTISESFCMLIASIIVICSVLLWFICMMKGNGLHQINPHGSE